jgi:hypothetical protein
MLAHGHHAAPDGAFSFCELVFYNYAAPPALSRGGSGRVAARQAGLVVAGVSGKLLHAKLHGEIPAIKPELHRLRKAAGFSLMPELNDPFFHKPAHETLQGQHQGKLFRKELS